MKKSRNFDGNDDTSTPRASTLIEQCSDCAKMLNHIAKHVASDPETMKAISVAKRALLFIATRDGTEFRRFLEQKATRTSAAEGEEIEKAGPKSTHCAWFLD